MTSRRALEKVPRLDKRWIHTRNPTELHQAVQYIETQEIPHWGMDQHQHRDELTKMIHEATRGKSTKKTKPMKPYVTDDILKVSAQRTRLIKTIPREKNYAKFQHRKRVFSVWREISHWIAGHRRPTHVSFYLF